VARLPAAISAAAAITAVAIPASAPAATATTTARPPSAATAKAAAATPASGSSSTATAATLTRGPCFVHDNIAAHEIMAVQSLDCALGFLVAIDFDKSEPAWLP
jgi:Tfp pilus assembly protein PilV